MPEISVIVPTRKRNHLLPRALKSLFVQTFQDFEIIVVDDNPPDCSLDADANLRSILRHPKIRIVRNHNPRNASAARNCGLRIAQGNWITYLDDDDAYLPAKLEKQLLRARETGLPLGLCGLTYRLAGRSRPKQVSQESFTNNELLLKTLPDTKAIFHRRADILFNEDLFAGEDAYLFFDLIRKFGLKKVFNIAEPLVEVYFHSGPRVNRNAESLWKANQAIYKDFALGFGEVAAKIFYLRTRLQYFKFCSGGFVEMSKLTVALLRLHGMQELRLILNVWLFKIPWLRRFLV